MNVIERIKINLNFPNILSIFRIIILIPFVKFILKDNYIVSGFILIISGISDMLDGIIARKFNQVTDIGKMLDPVADKVTLVTIMICVSIKSPKMLAFMIILVIKEILMLSAGIILLKNNKKPPTAKWYGKLSTIIFYVSVICIISIKAIWNVDFEILNTFLMVFTMVFMIYSLWRYFEIFKLIINNNYSEK